MPLPVEEVLAVLHFPPLTPIDLSPDGRWVAYTLQNDLLREQQQESYTGVYFTHTGVYRLETGCNIWIANTQTGESKNLTDGKGSNWSPVWSPDGNYLAFYSDRSGVARLWVWEKSSGKLLQVSDEIVHPFYPFEAARWSADSRRILVKILPEGRTIEGARDAIVSPPQMEKQGASGPTVLVYRSSASQKESPSGDQQNSKDIWTSYRRADLALMEVGTGNVRRIATGFNPAWYDFSPDGSSVAFTSTKGFESLQSQQRVYDLAVVSPSDARPRIIAPNIQLDYVGMTVSWSPDGKMLSYITSSSGGPVKGDCFIVSVNGGVPLNVTPTSHPYFSNAWRAPLWNATGECIYLLSSDSIWKVDVKEKKAEKVATMLDRKIVEAVAPREGGRFWLPDGGRSMIITTRDNQTKQEGFYKIDLNTGKSMRLMEEKRSYGDSPIYNMDVDGDGKHVVYIAEDAAHSAEIWMAGVDFKNPKQVTHINPQLDRYLMGMSRVIEWQGLDGETLRGALLLPAGYQEGKRYPLIVKVYPTANLSDNVNNFGLGPNGAGVDNMQLFATRGYAVLLPDSPSSKGTPMQSVAKTVLPGVAKAIELEIADPARLGVMGHSYGGYGTLSLIVQTTRFKAAVCNAGFGNRIGDYGQMRPDGSSPAVGKEEESYGMGGPPWQFPNKYLENSPVFYLDRVQTPLLIVQSTTDWTVQPFLADEIFVGLRRLGKEVEYAKYGGEQHWEGAWGHVNQVDYLTRIINWFDKHLKQDQGLKSVTKNSGQTR
jgi:dipeptidyl aminopeptidase/acylaminoacyl peptidase